MPVPLVVVGAHPDDETIGAAGLLLRAGRAAVVHLTDGAPRDPGLWPRGERDREGYARRRRAEALQGLAEAGLAPRDVVALGATDQEALQDLAPLARELATALAALEPRIVVGHAFEGGHPDHDAAALATRVAVALLERHGVARPVLFDMTSYHRGPSGLEAGRFLPGGSREVAHTLTSREQAAKARMLEAYASQRALLALVGPSVAEVERFRLAGALRLARPHPGPLHYEARGWITFERFRVLAEEGLAALGPESAGAHPG